MTQRKDLTIRAAIVTPYGLFNYGNRLQNHAVVESLLKWGIRADTLILRNDYVKSIPGDFARLGIHSLRLKGEVSRKYRAFREFDRRIKTRRVWGQNHLDSMQADYDLI